MNIDRELIYNTIGFLDKLLIYIDQNYKTTIIQSINELLFECTINGYY